MPEARDAAQAATKVGCQETRPGATYRAQEVLTELETRHLRTEPNHPGRKRRRDPPPQPSLFADLEVRDCTGGTEGKTG